MLEAASLCFLQWPRVDKQTLIWTLVTIIISSSTISSSTKKTSGKNRGANTKSVGQERRPKHLRCSQGFRKGHRLKLTVDKSRCGAPTTAGTRGPVWQVWTSSLEEISPDSQRPQWGGASCGSTQKMWDCLVHEGLKSSWILVMHSFLGFGVSKAATQY